MSSPFQKAFMGKDPMKTIKLNDKDLSSTKSASSSKPASAALADSHDEARDLRQCVIQSNRDINSRGTRIQILEDWQSGAAKDMAKMRTRESDQDYIIKNKNREIDAVRAANKTLTNNVLSSSQQINNLKCELEREVERAEGLGRDVYNYRGRDATNCARIEQLKGMVDHECKLRVTATLEVAELKKQIAGMSDYTCKPFHSLIQTVDLRDEEIASLKRTIVAMRKDTSALVLKLNSQDNECDSSRLASIQRSVTLLTNKFIT